MVKVNINDNVKVKLSQMGMDIYYHQYDDVNKKYGRIVIEPSYPKQDEEGYTKFQIHTLMSLYGQYMYLGGSVEINTLPFEMIIYLCD